MMKPFSFDLIDGLTMQTSNGEETHKHVEFKTLKAGDIFRAQDESEVPTPTANGYELVTSPSRLSRTLMRLSISKLGSLDGVGEPMLRKLSERDYNLLLEKYAEFDGMQNAILQKRLKESEELGKN